jgi:hypothetical protein
MTSGYSSAEFEEGSGDPSVLGRWTESREGGGGSVLERG